MHIAPKNYFADCCTHTNGLSLSGGPGRSCSAPVTAVEVTEFAFGMNLCLCLTYDSGHVGLQWEKVKLRILTCHSVEVQSASHSGYYGPSGYNTRGEKVGGHIVPGRGHGRSASLKRFTPHELHSLFRGQKDNQFPKLTIKIAIIMNKLQ